MCSEKGDRLLSEVIYRGLNMRALVIGLGSMGKRRIRLMRQLNKEIDIIGVDSRKDRCRETEEAYQISAGTDLAGALAAGADLAFICTAPLSHADLISLCLENGMHVFSELNLVSDGYDKNIALAKEKGLVLFLSSTFLYRREIDYIRSRVKTSGSVLTYSYHAGQYLPDWHPWESYMEYFIGDNRTNGCRELMAIEFPWLCKVFGSVLDVTVKRGKKTALKTGYADSYVLLLEHENGIQGAVCMDVVSRKPVRNLEIFGEDIYFRWDGSARGLWEYHIDRKMEEQIDLYDSVDRQDGYAQFIVENAYLNEILAFYAAVEDGKQPEYGFLEDKEILALIDRIEG